MLCNIPDTYYKIQVFSYVSQKMRWHHDYITSWHYACVESKMTSTNATNKVTRQVRLIWRSPRVKQLRHIIATWRDLPYSGPVVLILGTLLATLFIMAFDRSMVA